MAFPFLSLRGDEGDEAISEIATPRQVGAHSDIIVMKLFCQQDTMVGYSSD